MMTPKTFVICLAMLLLGGGAWFLLDQGAEVRRQESIQALRLAHRDAVQREFVARTNRLHTENRAAFELEIRRREQVERLLGGPLDAIVKEPGVGISEMIRRLAVAVVPQGATPVVRVERFTEFLLSVDLPSAATYDEMAAWSREIVSRAGRYLHLVRFIREGMVVGEIDRGEIEQIRDWGKAGTPEIVSRLKNSPELETGVGESTAGEVDLSALRPAPPAADSEAREEEEKGPNAAYAQFNSLVKARMQGVTNALTEMGKAINLGLLRSSAATRARVAALEATIAELQPAKVFFHNPAAAMDEILATRGAEALYRSITVRTLKARYNAVLQADRMFNSFSEYGAVLKSFLDTMERYRSSWTLTSDGQRLDFADPSVDVAYQKAIRQCERAREVAIQAYQEWQRACWTGVAPEAPAK
ncbi:MAG TPA: hypothetical protein DCM86_10060 [Verrucomicrobiales bacterium]|nr:hypothetical protein [Verrucomicrobiales bacterium]